MKEKILDIRDSVYNYIINSMITTLEHRYSRIYNNPFNRFELEYRVLTEDECIINEHIREAVISEK